jgi:hypothetical protein
VTLTTGLPIHYNPLKKEIPMTFLSFVKESITAKLISPSGDEVEKIIEIRTHPITGRTCRVALSRTGQSEPGTDVFPEPPPYARNTAHCPFCLSRVESQTRGFFPECRLQGD